LTELTNFTNNSLFDKIKCKKNEEYKKSGQTMNFLSPEFVDTLTNAEKNTLEDIRKIHNQNEQIKCKNTPANQSKILECKDINLQLTIIKVDDILAQLENSRVKCDKSVNGFLDHIIGYICDSFYESSIVTSDEKKKTKKKYVNIKLNIPKILEHHAAPLFKLSESFSKIDDNKADLDSLYKVVHESHAKIIQTFVRKYLGAKNKAVVIVYGKIFYNLLRDVIYTLLFDVAENIIYKKKIQTVDKINIHYIYEFLDDLNKSKASKNFSREIITLYATFKDKLLEKKNKAIIKKEKGKGKDSKSDKPADALKDDDEV
jgi:hypothetical protein